jgi:short-subunit dehydrogenase
MAEQKNGPIEMVICCAATSKPAMFLSSDLDQFKHHMDLNFIGVLKFILPIAKRMSLRRTLGRICLVGDPIASQHAIPGISPYACSKAALEQLAY